MTNFYDKLPERLRTVHYNPLQAVESDSDLEAIADAILATQTYSQNDPYWVDAGKSLLLACLGYLRDWCSSEQRTFDNLKALVSAAIYKTSAPYSDLDNLFYQMKSGCKRVVGADGITTDWEVSDLVRNDGLCPRDTNGIQPSEDYALGCYERFYLCAPPTRSHVAMTVYAILVQIMNNDKEVSNG